MFSPPKSSFPAYLSPVTMSERIFALVVGINQYQSDKVTNLQGCVRDAESVRNIVLRYTKDAQVCLLTDASATRAEITRAFSEHLMDNPRIVRNDPIVVYFAGRGRRVMAPPGGSGRDVDMLLPSDYCDDVPGMSDISVNALLSDLAEKKGTNITFILDTSFSFWIPRGKAVHRSDTSEVPPSHISIAWNGDSPQYTGFYSGAASPYVLLAACQQNEIAIESSNGGIFTQSLVAAIAQNKAITYRELAIGSRSYGQNPICSGLHADRVLFSIPSESRIPKLHVFLDMLSVELEIKPEDAFVRVADKRNARVALRSDSDGGFVIERLDDPVALYGSREVSIAAEYSNSLSYVLNKIAHFHHYLCVEPPRTPPSSSLGFWRQSTQPMIDLYHFKCSETGIMKGRESRNLLRNNLAHFDSSTADRAFGLKITNHSDMELYPYLLCFDPAKYVVQSLHTPPPSETSLPPLKPGSSFTVGFGVNGGAPLKLTVDTQKEQDAAFFKIIMCEKPVDLRYMLQEYALTSAPPSHSAFNHGAPISFEIPGFWDTTMATLSVRPSSHSTSCWKRLAHILRNKFMPIR